MTIPELYLSCLRCNALARIGQTHEQKLNNRSSLFGGANLCCRGEKRGSCSSAFAA